MRISRYLTVLVMLIVARTLVSAQVGSDLVPEQALVTIKTYIVSGTSGEPTLSFPGFPRMSMAVLEESIADAEMFVEKLRSLYAFSTYQVMAVSSVRTRQDASGLWRTHVDGLDDPSPWSMSFKDFSWDPHGRLQMMVRVTRDGGEFLASHVSVLPERSVVLGRFADEEMSEAIFAIVVPTVDVTTQSPPSGSLDYVSSRKVFSDAAQQHGLPPIERRKVNQDLSCETIQAEKADEFAVLSELPALIEQVPPEYPPEAEKAGIEGTVWVRALVDKNGKVSKACVLKSSGRDDFDRESVKAAIKYRYSPAKDDDGKPVSTWVTYRVTFVLQ